MVTRRCLRAINIVFLMLFGLNAQAREPGITIAIASNFYYPLTQVIEQSPIWKNRDIRLVSGSSGTLYAQALKGAPFDVFLSADAQRPNALYEKGLSTKPVSYAIGKLVLWPADKSLSLKDNLLSATGRIAIANPQTAPFGKAATDFLHQDSAYQALQSRLVMGNSVAQAFQFVDSGNAELGLLAASVLIQAHAKQSHGEDISMSSKYQNYLLVPNSDYRPIEQQAVILERGNRQSNEFQVAEAFLAFLLSDEVQMQLSELGYESVAK